MRIRFLIFLDLVLPAVLAAQAALNVQGKIVLTGQVNTPPSIQINCVAANNCQALTVAGDPDDNSGFSGKADPTIRQDPLGKIWAGYSHLKTVASAGGAHVVEIHTAYWNQGTNQWSTAGLSNGGVLYPTQQVPNGQTGAPNDQSSHEVFSLRAFLINGVPWWAGINSDYQTPFGGSGNSQTYTERQHLAMCPDTTGGVQGPMCLASASPQYLGGTAVNQTYWSIGVNLTTISGTSCPAWREPTFLYDPSTDTLYLIIECSDLSAYYEFSTLHPTSTANLGHWAWSLVSATPFATPADAAAICGLIGNCATTDYLTQGEFALGFNSGVPMMCFDDVHITAGNKIADAGVCIQLATTAPLSFAKIGSQPKVLSIFTSTDSLTAGPGTIGYEPAFPFGALFPRKITNCNTGQQGCNGHTGFYSEIDFTNKRP